MGTRPGSQVAKALLCKRSIRECKSRPGLKIVQSYQPEADPPWAGKLKVCPGGATG